jgi:hypothetical protein
MPGPVALAIIFSTSIMWGWAHFAGVIALIVLGHHGLESCKRRSAPTYFYLPMET